jgi:hypothetical protein
MDWIKSFSKGKELVLATSSKKNVPNANIVISLGFIDNKLLIADCQMKATLQNLKENQNVCVIAKYLRLKGTVKIFSSGKYFDQCVEETKEYKVKNAILIIVKEVFDLNKTKKIF